MHRISRQPFPYIDGGVELEGVLVRDETAPEPQPGVLLIHEFTGIGDYILGHAERLAGAGFVVLACDMYGRGIRPGNAAEASRLSRIYRNDRKRMRERAAAGLRALATADGVRQDCLSTLGFSFGGCAALELARSGARLSAACSVYGYLHTDLPAGRGDIRCPTLVLHGARDRVVPMADVTRFAEEMRDAEADCRIVIYSNAGHGFCNPGVETDPRTGSAYDPDIAARAWREIMDFLRDSAAAEIRNRPAS